MKLKERRHVMMKDDERHILSILNISTMSKVGKGKLEEELEQFEIIEEQMKISTKTIVMNSPKWTSPIITKLLILEIHLLLGHHDAVHPNEEPAPDPAAGSASHAAKWYSTTLSTTLLSVCPFSYLPFQFRSNQMENKLWHKFSSTPSAKPLVNESIANYLGLRGPKNN